MKTAIWLYLFMFVAMFDLHAQYPILSPFALSVGAAPSFIGLIMGVYSITHLPGNLLAGYGVDRYGSRLFIVFSLIGAGVILILQSRVTNPWQLLFIRSISGFVLAFLSPACMSLLAKLAKSQFQQGKLMAGNGLTHTLASVVSPAAGAMLVAKFGFAASFNALGWALIFIGGLALFTLRDVAGSEHPHAPPAAEYRQNTGKQIPWLFYGLPLAISCAQGILYFELPLMQASRQSVMTSGWLFSIISIGSLVTLSMFFLNHLSPFVRTVFGSLGLAFIFFGMAVLWPLPFTVSLFMIGMAQGVIFPALSTLLISLSNSAHYGRVFSMMSISFSLGAFAGPVLAGQLREQLSPYYIAFLSLMIALLFIPFLNPRTLTRTRTQSPST